MAEAPIRIGIFEGFRNHAFVTLGIAPLTVAECIDRVFRVSERLIDVIISNALFIGIDNYRHRGVTKHTAGIRIQNFPTR